MEAGATWFSLFRPEVARTVFLLSAAFWLASALDSEELVREVTTEGFPAYETTPNVTESPGDNGMAIGDIPREIAPTTLPTAPQSKEEEPSALEHQPVRVSFPDNHKNFTPGHHPGDRDSPPYHSLLNSYQQQYQNYQHQKQIYSRKPIKFEEDSLDNYYLPPNSLDAPSDHNTGSGLLRVHRTPNPFPYSFDHEHNWQKTPPTHDPKPHADWYNPAPPPQDSSYKVNENAPEDWYKHTRGHQEAPHYLFPPAYHQEDRLLHSQPPHLDHHHHENKDLKENPWKKVFHVLTALVPFGLLLASLTPNVIAINSTANTKATRHIPDDPPPLPFNREDVLDLISKYGVSSIADAQCEDRMLCELATEGSKVSAGAIEKGFWFLANQTPRDVAEKAGMNDLFKAIKTGNCETFKCHAKVKPPSPGKKVTWKEKNPRPARQQTTTTPSPPPPAEAKLQRLT